MENLSYKPKRFNSLDQNESASKSMKNYNESSLMQLKWINQGAKAIELAAPLFQDNSGNFTVVDFACSHGKNSMTVINKIFDQLKEKNISLAKNLKEIIIYHNDLPDNDFDEVLKCVENKEIGYKVNDLIKLNDIKLDTRCVGRTYYEQIVENEAIDFAFCYTSLHWMPEYQGLDNCVVFEKEHEEYETFQWFTEISDRYLFQWLDLRHQELKSSGLLSFNLCTFSNFPEIANKGWASLLKSKNIKPSELKNVTIPIFIRTEEQVIRLFDYIKDKYKVLISENIKDTTEMDKPTFKAVSYNQIVTGLNKYPELFPNMESIETFYVEFEKECYNSGETRTLISGFEWILLQKI